MIAKIVLVIGSGLLVACMPQRLVAKDDSVAWMYLKSDGDIGTLSLDQNTFRFPDTKFDTEFCAPESKYHCFSSSLVVFAIPKSGDELNWIQGGRSYCVVKNYDLNKGAVRNGDMLYIVSAPGNSCLDTPADEIFIYSKATGLRFISIRTKQFNADLISLNTIGFGAR